MAVDASIPYLMSLGALMAGASLGYLVSLLAPWMKEHLSSIACNASKMFWYCLPFAQWSAQHASEFVESLKTNLGPEYKETFPTAMEKIEKEAIVEEFKQAMKKIEKEEEIEERREIMLEEIAKEIIRSEQKTTYDDREVAKLHAVPFTTRVLVEAFAKSLSELAIQPGVEEETPVLCFGEIAYEDLLNDECRELLEQRGIYNKSQWRRYHVAHHPDKGHPMWTNDDPHSLAERKVYNKILECGQNHPFET